MLETLEIAQLQPHGILILIIDLIDGAVLPLDTEEDLISWRTY